MPRCDGSRNFLLFNNINAARKGSAFNRAQYKHKPLGASLTNRPTDKTPPN